MNRAQRRQAAKATKAKPGRGQADPFSYLRAFDIQFFESNGQFIDIGIGDCAEEDNE